MSLATFQAAVHQAAAKYAPQYGLTAAELEYAMLADAHLEGGHGDTAGVGDGGASVGRFQYNMSGGHGSSLLNQGYTRAQIADDAFQANDWAPILAQQLAAVKKQGMSGGQAVAQAIFQAERPATMYPQGRINAALAAAGQLTGQPSDAVNGRAQTDLGAIPNLSTLPGSLDESPATPIPNADPNGYGPPTPISNTSQPSDAQSALQAANSALNALIQSQPGMDDPAFPAWSVRVDALQKYVNSLTTQAGQRDTGFQNSQSQFTDKVTLDTAAQNRAQNEITNYQNGATESRGRATLNLDAQKLLAQWGTAPGKDKFYASEDPATAATYKAAGLDPNGLHIGYTGTQHIDPGADLAAGDARFGAGGAPPTLPQLTVGRGDIPDLPKPPEWPSVPTGTGTYSLNPGGGFPPSIPDTSANKGTWWKDAITPGDGVMPGAAGGVSPLPSTGKNSWWTDAITPNPAPKGVGQLDSSYGSVIAGQWVPNPNPPKKPSAAWWNS